MMWLVGIVVFHLSLFLVNAVATFWIDRHDKHGYELEVGDLEIDNVPGIILGSFIPFLNFVVSYGLTRDGILLAKMLKKQKKEKRIEDDLRKNNPQWEVIDVLEEIAKLYAYSASENFYHGKLRPSLNFLQKNKTNIATKYLLENYQLSLQKLLSILNESKSMPKEKQKGLYESGEKLLSKTFNETQKIKEDMEIVKAEVEQKTYERMMDDIKRETLRHPEEYLTNEVRTSIRFKSLSASKK